VGVGGQKVITWPLATTSPKAIKKEACSSLCSFLQEDLLKKSGATKSTFNDTPDL
jgi:hypothetical protein